MIDLSEISARIISTKDVYLCNEQWQGTKTRLVINDSILLSSFCIYANDYFSNMPAHLIGTAIAQIIISCDTRRNTTVFSTSYSGKTV